MTEGWRHDHAYLIAFRSWQLVGQSKEAIWRTIGETVYGISPAIVHDPADWNGLWRLHRMGEPFPPFQDLTYIAQSTLLLELNRIAEERHP